jgi:hypothetical protein
MSLKKLLPIILTVILAVALNSCNIYNSYFGRVEVALGQIISPAEAASDGHVLWTFSNLPESSKLLGFVPNDSSIAVSFKPDVIGKYDVLLTMGTGKDATEISYFYTVVENPNGTEDGDATPPEMMSDNTADTSSPNADLKNNDSNDYFKQQGIERSYMDKLVVDGNGDSSAKATPSVKKKKSVKKEQPAKKKSIASQKKQTKKSNGIYTIQVASYPEIENAQATSKKLLDGFGIESYIQRVFIAEKDKVFYRVRVGRFNDFKKANAYAEEMRNNTKFPVWVDNLREEL